MAGASILLIEDDPNLRGMLGTVLEEEEYEVVIASNAEEAILAAATNEFRLVLTDVRLGSMDGVECLREVRRVQPAVKAIVITGYASEDVPARAIRGRADDYIYKPFELHELLNSVERVLEGAKESRDYNDLFSSVVADYGGFRKGSISVEDARDRAFGAFFVGVRSRRLSQGRGYEIWLKLEDVETRRIMVLDDDSEEPEDVLAGAFYTLSQEVAESDPDQPSTPEPSPHLEPRLFANLFENVLSGQVSIELLKRAMFLRKMDQSLLASSEPLKKLYQSTWGK